MEDYQANSSLSSKVPMILGILGMLLGIGGIIFGMQAKSRALGAENAISAIQAVQSENGSAQSRLQTMEAQIAGITSANDALALQVDALNKGLRQLTEQTRDALNQVGQAINENRRHLGGSSSGYSSNGSGEEQSYTPGGTYVIQSGDSFWKIASRMGISSKALEAVNPDVDPSRLRIGQEINLPE